MILIDPGFRPPRPLPELQPPKVVQPDPTFPIDIEIVNFLRDQSEAVSAWTMINSVAANFNPPNRSKSRELKKLILSRISRLIHTKHIRRVARNYLAAR